MYNNYTPLQQRQLALQEYSNTQSTYLLVCAPARSTALKATLTDQLHRKFRLVDRLDGELTASVDGVLLAAEDVELMSTALMYFAKALQDGADYAVCNAVFGFGGATALYQSQPLQAQNRCAVVSRALLERCRAAAHDPENVPELLALAAQLCTRPTLIPQALLHYERGICAEDAFSAHGKRAFIMSHVLDMTGAPIVLVSAVPVLRSMGYEVLVLGPSDGGSLHLFLDAGASVIPRSSCRNVSDAWGMALCADFVIANTVVMARAVRAPSGPPPASGGAFRPLDSPPPTVLFYPRRRGIYHHRALLFRGPAPWDKVSRSKAPLLFQSVLFLRLCQFGRLFLFPVVQQGHNLFFHFGGSDLLAKILRQFRC